MHVEIVERPPLRVGAIRHVGPYADINRAFRRLATIAGQMGLLQRADAEMIAIYHDDPDTTPPDALRSDAGLTMGPDVRLPRELTEQRLAAGRYARTVHVGPYAQLDGVWRRLVGEWLPQSGHRRGRGPGYEVYRNTPATTAPDRLVTDLYVPLA